MPWGVRPEQGTLALWGVEAPGPVQPLFPDEPDRGRAGLTDLGCGVHPAAPSKPGSVAHNSGESKPGCGSRWPRSPRRCGLSPETPKDPTFTAQAPHRIGGYGVEAGFA